MLPALTLISVEHVCNSFLVMCADMPGLGFYFFACFHINKKCISLKGKGFFFWVKNMKNNDFMFSVSEMLQSVKNPVLIIKKVGKNHDEPAAFNPFG